MRANRRIVIVGAGVVGLTCALVLSPDYDVTVVADRVGTSSESIKATAIWHVYLVPETATVLSWAQYSLEKFCNLAATTPDAGIEMIRGVELFRKGDFALPTWSKIPRFFAPLTNAELSSFNVAPAAQLSGADLRTLEANPVRWGYRIEAPAAAMETYLDWLEGSVHREHVRFVNRKIKEFNELSADHDLIVDCSGFGARELAHDKEFIAYKGQYFVLKGSASSPREYVGDDDHPGGMAYMIPRGGEVLVGGCAEQGCEDLHFTLDWAETLKRAGLFVPWLRTRTREDQARPPVVGIRPCRAGGVRLEVDRVSASIPIIHNYGHGGSGFSLSWGCAEAVKAEIGRL